MIRYLNNAANEIQYTDKNGHTVTKNPFDPEFVFISQRLSLQHSNDAENQQRRNNYETAVRNAQISVDAGRPAPAIPDAPLRLITPEDYTEPEGTTAIWEPELLKLKPGPVATPKVDLGPDSTARPVSSHLDKAMETFQAFAPLLPMFLEFLKAITAHHEASTVAPVPDVLKIAPSIPPVADSTFLD